MKAMVLTRQGAPLELENRPIPEPGPGEVLIRVEACGVCRTDLHVVDGDLTEPALPLVPGHEIVGRIAAFGPPDQTRPEQDGPGLRTGQRVGVPWLGRTCGTCRYCREGQENLCDRPTFTGYDRDGGYADYTVADRHFVFPLAESPDAVALAPLMCAGLIGYRALKLSGEPERLGLYGFGAAAHILAQLARRQKREVYAFTRAGDAAAQRFARELGATWAGESTDAPPEELDAAIIFAPVGSLVPRALKAVRKGGCVVCGGIHMSDIPSFPYADLWNERRIVSVANLTRADGLEFLPLAEAAGIETHTTPYPLTEANAALDDLREGRLTGAAVLVP